MNFRQYIKEAKEKTKEEQVIELFTNNKIVTVDDLEKIGTDSIQIAFDLLSSFFNKGRYNESGRKVKLDPKELAMGVKVEMEHTSNKTIAERIAKDHLTEIPGTGNNDGYYSLLERMEAGVYDKE